MEEANPQQKNKFMGAMLHPAFIKKRFIVFGPEQSEAFFNRKPFSFHIK